MAIIQENPTLELRSVARNLAFVAVAVMLFLMKKQYAGPFQELIGAYAGNVTVSFALYFVFQRLCMMSPRFGRVIAAALVLACVESFELLDGFGFMANTYDTFDLLANAIGVGLAFSLDTVLGRKRQKDPEANVEA
jgi:glycopeptide antibiotics resistance protein